MDYQVPDLIEPYYGYKWLGVRDDGSLYSYVNRTNWPKNGPVVAKCHNDWGHEWVVRPHAEAFPKIVYGEHGPAITPTTGTITVPGQPPRQWVGDPYQIDPDLRLQIELPWGLTWSWEARPCPHEAPAEDCSCGIYAVNKTGQCDNYKRQRTVLVKVAVWGRVVRASEGVRGQYAYPVEVLKEESPTRIIETVREYYRIQLPKPIEPQPPPQPEDDPIPSMFPTVSRPPRNLRDRLGL